MGIPLLYLGFNILQFILYRNYHVVLYCAQLLLFSVVIYMTFRKEIVVTIRQLTGLGKQGAIR